MRGLFLSQRISGDGKGKVVGRAGPHNCQSGVTHSHRRSSRYAIAWKKVQRRAAMTRSMGLKLRLQRKQRIKFFLGVAVVWNVPQQGHRKAGRLPRRFTWSPKVSTTLSIRSWFLIVRSRSALRYLITVGLPATPAAWSPLEEALHFQFFPRPLQTRLADA